VSIDRVVLVKSVGVCLLRGVLKTKKAAHGISPEGGFSFQVSKR
jgi:Na+-translocating ferredoxin:NAD+ oxidoreductase RnfA subunit